MSLSEDIIEATTEFQSLKTYGVKVVRVDRLREAVKEEQVLWNDFVDGKITKAEFWIKRNEIFGEKLI